MTSRGMMLDYPGRDPGTFAAEIERHGFDTVWVSETNRESVVRATMALQATTRIRVGTNVTLAFPRSPTVAAMQAWDLNDLFDHRFVMGLGSQVRRIIEERFSSAFDRPAKRMEEYLHVMRSVWRMERGESSTFEGELYRVLRPGVTGIGDATGRPLPPVYLAAVGPLMTRAATRVADGLLGHPFTSERYLIEAVLPRVAEGLEAAGRSADDFELSQGVIVSVSDDRATALRDARRQIGFYGTTPNYQAVFEAEGDGELAGELRQVWKATRGDADALADAVPEAAVQRYAVAGTPDEVAERITAIERHVDHLILSGPWYQVDPGRQAENAEALLETLGRDT